MSFSTNMRATVLRQLTNLGNSCTLTKISLGEYIPEEGRQAEYEENIATYSTSVKNSSLVLSLGNSQNFNLSGFDEDKVLIPYIEGYDIDDTWRYTDKNNKKKQISIVEKIEAQNNTIAYIIEVKG